MLSEDNHSPLYSLLKTLRQFANPLSPQLLHSSLGFVCCVDKDRVMAQDDFLRIKLFHTILLNEKGTPVSINADVPWQMRPSLCFSSFLNSFALRASDVWFSERTGAGIGFTRAKKQVWEYDQSIWPCQRLKFMFASREGTRKQVYIVMACQQLEQSDFETGDQFSHVITDDFNVEIYRSSFILVQARLDHHLELDWRHLCYTISSSRVLQWGVW